MTKEQSDFSIELNSLYKCHELGFEGNSNYELTAWRERISKFQESIECDDDTPDELIELHLDCQVAMDSIDEELESR